MISLLLVVSAAVTGQSCSDLPQDERRTCWQYVELRKAITEQGQEIATQLEAMRKLQEQITRDTALLNQRLIVVEKMTDKHEDRIESLQRAADKAKGDLLWSLLKMGLITGASMGGVNVGVSTVRNRRARKAVSGV